MALAACGGGPVGDGSEEGLGGMGVPQQFPGEDFPGARGTVEVQVHLAGNGCFLGRLRADPSTGGHLVVWPAGTEQGVDGDELRLTDGSHVRHGDVLTGSGLVMPVERLTGFGADSFWDFAVGYCTPGASRVLVLDRVVEARREPPPRSPDAGGGSSAATKLREWPRHAADTPPRP